MAHADNKVCVHSSKAVGEPPFFLGTAVYFAIKKAVAAARAQHLNPTAPPLSARYYALHSPATSEKIRMACADKYARRAVRATAGGGALSPEDDSSEEAHAATAGFEARGSY